MRILYKRFPLNVNLLCQPRTQKISTSKNKLMGQGEKQEPFIGLFATTDKPNAIHFIFPNVISFASSGHWWFMCSRVQICFPILTEL